MLRYIFRPRVQKVVIILVKDIPLETRNMSLGLHLNLVLALPAARTPVAPHLADLWKRQPTWQEGTSIRLARLTWS